MRDLSELLRENVAGMTPYRSARHQFSGTEAILLDANEHPCGIEGLNRYPDPTQRRLKEAIARHNGVRAEQTFLGNGSDEVLDLLFRAFCRPGRDRVLIFSPTYGMYRTVAALNDVAVVDIPLNDTCRPDLAAAVPLLDDPELKMIFICSPNNPTGNLIPHEDLMVLAERFPGLVVVDEAYIDFAPEGSALPLLERFPNLVVVRTFSKGWGLAGIRLGAAHASSEIAGILSRIKPPYNIGTPTQRIALEALTHVDDMRRRVRQITAERERLHVALRNLPAVLKIFPSDANFLLICVDAPATVHQKLLKRGIVLRNLSDAVKGGLRITIGTPEENDALISELQSMDCA